MKNTKYAVLGVCAAVAGAFRLSFVFAVTALTCALLLPTPGRAQTSFTATGWVNAVLAPGIWATNALGQVLARGVVQTARVESPDPRVAGQVFIIVDGALNADGTANIQGPAYLQVGTWAGTNFTPSGGVWALQYRGVMQTNYSLQLSQVGYGIGGSIDGLRLEETVTREPAANPLDPTVPYLYAGTIKPPPVNTAEVVDDFRGPFTGTKWGKGTCYNSNGQFYAVGDFPDPTHSILDAVEGAPTVQGPWLPVQDLTIPASQQLAVPASGPAQFFRLIQAP